METTCDQGKPMLHEPNTWFHVTIRYLHFGLCPAQHIVALFDEILRAEGFQHANHGKVIQVVRRQYQACASLVRTGLPQTSAPPMASTTQVGPSSIPRSSATVPSQPPAHHSA